MEMARRLKNDFPRRNDLPATERPKTWFRRLGHLLRGESVDSDPLRPRCCRNDRLTRLT